MADSDNNVIYFDNSAESVAETITVSSESVNEKARPNLKTSHFGQPVVGFPNYYLAFQNEATAGYVTNQNEAGSSSAAKNMAAPMDLSNEIQTTQKMCREQQNALSSLTAAVNSLREDMARKNKRQITSRKRPASTISDSESDFQSEGEASGSEDSDNGDNETDGPTAPKTSKILEMSTTDRKMEKLKKRKETFIKENIYAPAVGQQLSETINEGLKNPVEHKNENVKSLLDKYIRPENCEYLSVPKVEKSLWTSRHTNKEIKDSDKLLQRTQNYITKGIIPIVTLMNKSLNNDTLDAEEVMDLAGFPFDPSSRVLTHGFPKILHFDAQ